MNEMVLAAHRLSKATGCHSDCISAAQSHIFAIKILAYSCDPWKCIPNIKTQNIKLLQRYVQDSLPSKEYFALVWK